MKKGLNGFPLDNSMSTQVKYDLFVEKMNIAQRSYEIRNQKSNSLNLFGGIFQIIGGMILLIVGLVVMIINSSKKLS